MSNRDYTDFWAAGWQFQPSYGDESASVPAAPGGVADSGYSLEELSSAASAFLFGKESREEAAVVRAKIENLQALAQSAVIPFQKNYYLNEINKQMARLKVLEQTASESAYTAQTSAVTRTAVAASSVLGIMVVGGIALYMGTLIVDKMQETKIKKAELERLRRA